MFSTHTHIYRKEQAKYGGYHDQPYIDKQIYRLVITQVTKDRLSYEQQRVKIGMNITTS